MADYSATRDRVEQYFDRSATKVWERLTSDAPVSRIRQTVREGDTILIIEAMKTMNHIPAPLAGTVRRILVEDGGAVEYGAPLVIIE